MHKAAVSCRGHTCTVCGEIGAHLDDQCPSKMLVGMPEVMRQQLREEAVVLALGSSYHPAYLSQMEMLPLLRMRMDMPPYLSCLVCCSLAQNAVWCKTCDAVSCSLCLAPLDEPWMCPKCGHYDEDNFFVVQPLRDVIAAWERAMAFVVDSQTVFASSVKT